MTDPQPLPEICPFLASINDPDSVYNYPSEENRCGKPGGQIPIASDYQLAYCLRTRHWFCPVFTGAVKKPPVPIRFEGSLGETARNNAPLTLPTVPRLDKLAPVISSEGRIEPQPGHSTRGLAVLFLVCLLGIGVGSVILLSGRLSEVASSPLPATATTTSTATATPSPSASDTQTPTMMVSLTRSGTPIETATLTSANSATSNPTATQQASASSTLTSTVTIVNVTLKACTPPANWQAYTVAVGETYYKIAVKFNTTVDALQRVNCLSNPGKLLAGQSIYVPPLTPTP